MNALLERVGFDRAVERGGALGVIAALSQIGIAIAVTLPVLIAVLATVGGILIVGVGGGLVGPMRHRWERILDRAEREAPRAGAETDPLTRRAAVDEDPAQSAPTEQIPVTEAIPDEHVAHAVDGDSHH